MRGLKFSPLYLVILMFVALALIPLGISYSGFCPSEMRFVSDEEKIRSAFRRAINKPGFFQPFNVDNFLANNPGCCRIGLEPGDVVSPTLYQRYFGVISDVVVVEYLDNVLAPENQPHFKIKKQYGVSWCGKVFSDYLFGFDKTSLVSNS